MMSWVYTARSRQARCSSSHKSVSDIPFEEEEKLEANSIRRREISRKNHLSVRTRLGCDKIKRNCVWGKVDVTAKNF